MAQPMPSHTLDAELVARRRKLTIEKIPSAERRATPGCKYQCFRIAALRLEYRQYLDSLRAQWHRSLASPGLWIIETCPHKRPASLEGSRGQGQCPANEGQAIRRCVARSERVARPATAKAREELRVAA